jgi:hypothetical protein
VRLHTSLPECAATMSTLPVRVWSGRDWKPRTQLGLVPLGPFHVRLAGLSERDSPKGLPAPCPFLAIGYLSP